MAGGLFVVGSDCVGCFRLNWAIANFLLLLLPAGYLLARSTRARHMISAVFVTKFVLFALVFFDYLCRRFGGWAGPTVFPFSLQGVLIEEVLWMGFYIPFVLTINEHFFASNDVGNAPQDRTHSHFGHVLYRLGRGADPPRPHVLLDLHLSEVGVILYPPVFAMAIAVNWKVVRELLLTGMVTGIVCLVWEIIGLRNGFWHFPGTYIGHVSILG